MNKAASLFAGSGGLVAFIINPLVDANVLQSDTSDALADVAGLLSSLFTAQRSPQRQPVYGFGQSFVESCSKPPNLPFNQAFVVLHRTPLPLFPLI